MSAEQLTVTIMVQNLVQPFLKFPGIDYVRISRQVINHSIGEHGFAMLLDVIPNATDSMGIPAKTVLWDTGSINHTILHNLPKAGRTFSEVDSIALSHGHFDHVGALYPVLAQVGHPVDIIAHPHVLFTRYHNRSGDINFTDYYGKPTEEIQEFVHSGKIFKFLGLVESTVIEHGGNLLLTRASTVLFEDDCYKITTTGEIPRVFPEEMNSGQAYEEDGLFVEDQILDDTALVIERKEPGDAVVLLGCGHAGLKNTLSHVEDLTGRHVSVVVGGTHMGSASAGRLQDTLDFLQNRMPCALFPIHCSGPEFGRAINALSLPGLSAFDASVATTFTF